ncbi:hypothetical protein PISMIDRAFT_689566 [Pisolithus microcarpus 441]|uniref:Uncharacterized protein n=1 Tax=Pisolithus microcarpus 441 TaxID=765257 RepID=A0A0C9YWS2_9AGAM|nr:hypothetical protein PISMIDRAFT_689566 [Pisolithus microcarpus 441]
MHRCAWSRGVLQVPLGLLSRAGVVGTVTLQDEASGHSDGLCRANNTTTPMRAAH